MKDDFDKAGISLKRIHSEILEGMIYVNFADQPAPFELVRAGLTECLRPYRIDKAKVAHRQVYPIDANWMVYPKVKPQQYWNPTLANKAPRVN